MQDFWQSFFKLKGALVADLGIVLSVVFWLISPAQTWEVRWVLAFGVVVFTSLILALMILFDLLSDRNRQLKELKAFTQTNAVPNVIDVHLYSPDHFVLVLGPTDIFFDNALVSIFQTIKSNGLDFDDQIGIGRVSNIQQGRRMIQITPMLMHDHAAAVWESIKKKEQNILASIICKPSVSFDYVEIKEPSPPIQTAQGIQQ